MRTRSHDKKGPAQPPPPVKHKRQPVTYSARLEEELLASAQRHKLGTVFKVGDRETLGDRILPRQPSGSNVGPIPPSGQLFRVTIMRKDSRS